MMKANVFTIIAIAILTISALAVSQNAPQENAVYHASRPGDGSGSITPNDSTDLPRRARSLFIEGGGTIAFTALDGTTDTWVVPDNFYLNVQVVRVLDDGTDATGIHAIY
jgi:hypothetical protein